MPYMIVASPKRIGKSMPTGGRPCGLVLLVNQTEAPV